MLNSKPEWTALVLAFVVGMAAIVGAAVTVKATDGPAFCAGCHSMNEAAWTHKQSLHRQFDCAECHLPANLVSKLPYKAEIGLHDVYVNTTGVPDLIHSSAKMKDVIQANCRRCHASTVMDVAMDAKPYCTDCHRSVPHNKKTPIDRRKAADA
ncbi:NapC/NirT family cytochrome c [Desulfovibrio sp. OttesenSCG-928-F20]|nr:NapC/NirT family cytochrome c [Desulfovibrio sp. OttesenSCG-928-M16]MDL2291412.1 NapC/NirT family cytochrome c [Desulfovibrio sp. OttesenSCG-928-F20]